MGQLVFYYLLFFFMEGPSLDELQTIRQNHLSPNYKTIYDEPLIIHNGKMQWLFDHTGRKYLDMFAGIVTVSVGHCHPHVTAAVEKQLKQLWHTTLIYLHPNIHKYAQELVNKLPGDLKVNLVHIIEEEMVRHRLDKSVII